jgi:Dyp-type peroxidase family
MKMKETKNVHWHDVQGLILSGYPNLPFAAYVPCRFGVTDHAKAWLRDLSGRLMRVKAGGDRKEHRTSAHPLRPTDLDTMKKQLKGGAADVWVVNMALTWTGLKKFGVSDDERRQFSAEFREGMAPERGPESDAMPRRCNLLGDIGENSPEHWQWGGWTANRDIDGMLLLYAATKSELEKLTKYEMQQAQEHGVQFLESTTASKKRIPLILRGLLRKDKKEHFGFKDGISQPIIDGAPSSLLDEIRKDPKEARISLAKPGEFVLGYANERGTRVIHASDSARGQGRSKANKSSRDLTRNGTHLVFRQLEQDVGAFYADARLAAERIRGTNGKEDDENWEWVMARLIGRWRNGEPLIPPSTYSSQEHKQAKDDKRRESGLPAALKKKLEWFVAVLTGRELSDEQPSDERPKRERNSFLYYFEDRFGLACPLGAHIRRANPRDLVGPDPETALRLSKMHRIIRRGRPYGTKWTEKSTEGEQRGMLFICLNADIAGQFEFIQHTWINNGRFSGLYSETDPLLNYPGEARSLTIQRRPTSEHVDSMHQYVKVRGGAYFFLPGIETLRSLGA